MNQILSKIMVGVVLVSLTQSMAFARGYLEARKLLVAIEGGGAIELCPKTGKVVASYSTGQNAFGALYTPTGDRAFITDKSDGTLVEIIPGKGKVLSSLFVGKEPQQPALASDGRLFIPLSGEAAIAVIDTNGGLKLLRKISTGAETKPHIVSISPDKKILYVTVQGKDPKVVAIDVQNQLEQVVKEFRYDLVPRVVSAVNDGAYYTAHHSTGLHFADLATGKAATSYMDLNGSFSEPRKQIEGVSVTADGRTVAITHEGRRALIALQKKGNQLRKTCKIRKLSQNPYWVTLDFSGEVGFVSIPGTSLVEAYDLESCSQTPIWSTNVGGKPKRMDISE